MYILLINTKIILNYWWIMYTLTFLCTGCIINVVLVAWCETVLCYILVTKNTLQCAHTLFIKSFSSYVMNAYVLLKKPGLYFWVVHINWYVILYINIDTQYTGHQKWRVVNNDIIPYAAILKCLHSGPILWWRHRTHCWHVWSMVLW